MEPASIRYKNPGAMWGSALAKKWGSTKTVTLNDGKGQGNNIAVFDTYVQGICAQLDLWRTSPRYKNKPFSAAIAVWSGHNSVEQYIAYVLARVPGMTRDTVMDDSFWSGPMGLAFLKAQAGHEAGKVYPAPANDWLQAQRIVFSGKVVLPKKPDKDPTIPVVVSSTATVAAHTAGFPIGWVIAVSVASLLAFIGWKVYQNHRQVKSFDEQIEALTKVVATSPPVPVTMPLGASEKPADDK